MVEGKLLSIVVPTKNRYQYLKYLIELVAGFHSDEVELVIQDNSDDNTDFASYLKSLEYNFIRYDHIRGQIPMSINSDKAILNSTGEFVCFLGDDDGVTKYIIACAKWMKKNGIEAIKSSTIDYYWPDIIQYTSFTGSIIYLDPREELLKVLKKGITDRGYMPLVYHSIVRRDVLDEVYKKAGSFFPGNSPDISNAVALSLVVHKYAFIDFPLAFSGWSVFHGGGVHANGKKGHPEINEIPWFRPNAEFNWDNKVPRIAAGALIWADSAITSLKCMGEERLYNKINYLKMYASFVLNNPDYVSKVYDVCSNHIMLHVDVCLLEFKRIMDALIRRIGWVTGIKNRPTLEKNIDSTVQASYFLELIGDKVPCAIKN